MYLIKKKKQSYEYALHLLHTLQTLVIPSKF